MSLLLQHILTTSSISKPSLFSYIHTADQLRYLVKGEIWNAIPRYHNKTLITMFYEPSTRTNCSFQAAAYKLGCKVIALTEKASSSEKGESLEDTIRTLQHYGNAIVLRHPERGSAERAASVSNIPIINGGDGNGEHPTQALIDIFTIYFELLNRGINIKTDKRDIVNVTFVGDLKNSRTVHSLIQLLMHFPKIHFVYVSPSELEMPAEIMSDVRQTNAYEQYKMCRLEDAIKKADVLYMTRIQQERFSSKEAYDSVMETAELYRLTPSMLENAKKTMIIMHPLPRLEEIPVEIDNDHRAVYFNQVENGLYMRMAILDLLFHR